MEILRNNLFANFKQRISANAQLKDLNPDKKDRISALNSAEMSFIQQIKTHSQRNSVMSEFSNLINFKDSKFQQNSNSSSKKIGQDEENQCSQSTPIEPATILLKTNANHQKNSRKTPKSLHFNSFKKQGTEEDEKRRQQERIQEQRYLDQQNAYCYAQFIKACELRNNTNEPSKNTALQILEHLFNEKIMSYKTTFNNYLLKEAIILNYYKLIKQTRQIQRSRILLNSKNSQVFEGSQNDYNAKIVQILRIAYLFLKEKLSKIVPTPKGSRIHTLIMILANQQCNSGRYRQALQMCDECLKFLQHKNMINTQMLKIHHLRMNIYQKINNFTAELSEVNKCLFFLKATSFLSNSKRGIALYQELIRRKQELINNKQLNKKNVLKQKFDHGNSQIKCEKDNEETQRQFKQSKNAKKYRTHSKTKPGKTTFQFECTPSLYQFLQPQAQRIAQRSVIKGKMMNRNYKGRSISLGKLNQDQIDAMLQKTIQYNKKNKDYKSSSKFKCSTLHQNTIGLVKIHKNSRQKLQKQFSKHLTGMKENENIQNNGKATKRKLKRKAIPKCGSKTPYFSNYGSCNETPCIKMQQVERQLDNLQPLNQYQIADQKISNFIIDRPVKNNLFAATPFSQLNKKNSSIDKQSGVDIFGNEAGQSTMSNGLGFTNGFQKTQQRCYQVVSRIQNQLINKYVQLAEKGVVINFGIVDKKKDCSDIDFNSSQEQQSDWTQQEKSQKRISGSDEVNKVGKSNKQKKKNKQPKNNTKKEHSGLHNQSLLPNQTINPAQIINKTQQRIANRTFQISGLLINQEIGILEKATVVLSPYDDNDNFRRLRKNWFSRRRPSEDLLNQLVIFKKNSSELLQNPSENEVRSRISLADGLDVINQFSDENPYKKINFKIQIQFKNVKFLHKDNVLYGKKSLKIALKLSKNISFVSQDRVIDFEETFSIEQQRFILIKLLSCYIKQHKIDQQSVKEIQDRYLCFFRQKFWDDQISHIGQMNVNIYRQMLHVYLNVLLKNRLSLQQMLGNQIVQVKKVTIKEYIKPNSQQDNQIQEVQKAEKIYQHRNLCYEQHKQTIQKVHMHAIMKSGFVEDYYQKHIKSTQIRSIYLSVNQKTLLQIQGDDKTESQNGYIFQVKQMSILQKPVKTLKPAHLLSKALANPQANPIIHYPRRISLQTSQLVQRDNCSSLTQKQGQKSQSLSHSNSCYLFVMDKVYSVMNISSDHTLNFQEQYKNLCKTYKEKLTNYFLKFKSEGSQQQAQKKDAQKIYRFYDLMKIALVSYVMMPQSQPFSYAMKFFTVKTVTHIHKIRKLEADIKFNIKMICYTAKNMYSNIAAKDPNKIECFYKFQLQESEKRSRFLKFIMTAEDLMSIVKLSNKNDGLNIESVRQRQLSRDQMIKVLMRISQRLILRKQFLYFKLGIQNPKDFSYLKINTFNLHVKAQHRTISSKINSPYKDKVSRSGLSQSFLSKEIKDVLISSQKIIKIRYGKHCHFGIITVCKVYGSQLINISIYLPKKSRTFKFNFQQSKIIDYLSENDLNKIFGSVISNYQELQRKKLSQLIFVDHQQLKSEQNQVLVPLKIKRIIWNNFINLIEFEQFWTRQGCQLVVKISNYRGFIKDSSISEYFRFDDKNKNKQIFLLELSLQKNISVFASAKTIETKLKNESEEKREQLRKKSHKLSINQYKINVIESTKAKRQAQSFIVRQQQTNVIPYITYISSYFNKQQDILDSSVSILESQTNKQKIYVSLVNCFTMQKVNACYYISNVIQKFKNSQYSQASFHKRNQLNELIYRQSEINMLLKNLKSQIAQQIQNRFTQQQQDFQLNNFDFQAIFTEQQNQINRISLNSTKSSNNKYLSKNLTLINKQILSLTNDKIQCIFYDKKSKDLSFYLTSARQRSKNPLKSQCIGESSIPFLQAAGQKALKGLNKRIARNHKNTLLFQY